MKNFNKKVKSEHNKKKKFNFNHENLNKKIHTQKKKATTGYGAIYKDKLKNKLKNKLKTN